MWWSSALYTGARKMTDIFWAIQRDADKVPLIGGWMSGRFYSVAYQFAEWEVDAYELDRWVNEANISLTSILDWGRILVHVTDYFPWLKDPVGSLWSDIWRQVTARNTWLWDPITVLWDGIWGQVTAHNTWLKDPVSSLWKTIWDKVTGDNSWLKDPGISITGFVKDRFGDWFWDVLELGATQLARVGYKVLDKIWNMTWDDENKEVKS